MGFPNYALINVQMWSRRLGYSMGKRGVFKHIEVGIFPNPKFILSEESMVYSINT